MRSSKLLRREWWEFNPTPEHKSLVLLLYRSTLKLLLDFRSVRKKSLIAFTRMSYRRRSKATEKLLVDECVEEARRSIYILQKNANFLQTKEYEFDSMSLPKDTGQDVKTYMEEVYDPEVSKNAFSHMTDVTPGKEADHPQGSLAPTSSFTRRVQKENETVRNEQMKASKARAGGGDSAEEEEKKDKEREDGDTSNDEDDELNAPYKNVPRDGGISLNEFSKGLARRAEGKSFVFEKDKVFRPPPPTF